MKATEKTQLARWRPRLGSSVSSEGVGQVQRGEACALGNGKLADGGHAVAQPLK